MNSITNQVRMRKGAAINLRWRLGIHLLALGLVLGAGCSKESKVAGHIHRGTDYIKAGDYLKAEIELLNALRLDPSNMAVTRQLGDVYFQQGNIGKAYQFLNAAAVSGVADEDLRIKMARINLTGGKPKEARTEAGAVLDSRPESDEAWIVYGQSVGDPADIQEVQQKIESLRSRAERSAGFHLALGNIALRQNNIPAAAAAIQRAASIAPKLPVVHEMMATVYFRQKDVPRGGQSLKMAAELSPPRSIAPLRYADYLRNTGDEAGALKLVEDLVRQTPDYIPASVQLAQMHLAAKRFDAAAEAVKRVLSMDPANFEALMVNGRMSLAKGEKVQGLAEMTRLAQGYPGSPEAHYNLAIAQLLNNDPAKALASLGQAVNLNPDYVDARLLQAELILRKGDTTSVVNSMLELIAKNPQVARAYQLLGDAYSRRPNRIEALAAYSKLVELMPKSPQAHYLVGSVLVADGRPAEARKSFEKAQEISADYYPALEQLVELDLAERRFEEAGTRIQGQIQRAPKSAGPLVLLARLYLVQTNQAQAEAILRKAMEVEPEAPTAPVMLAQLMVLSGRAKEGLASLHQALAKNPKDVGVLMQIGMLENELKNYPAARTAYEELLKISPDNGPALNNLAILYNDQFGMHEQAYDMARRAREVVPNDSLLGAVIGDTLGWILVKRREYAWALGLLQASAQRLSNEPEAHYHYGVAQYMAGDEAGARSSLTKATATERAYEGRDDAVQRLQLLNADFEKIDAATLARMEKYLEEHPDDPLVARRLASLEEKKGAYDRAVAILERSIAANKGNAGAMVQAARLYSEHLKNPKKAFELAKAARETSPENPVMMHLMGALAYANGDATHALALLEESSRKLPGDPNVLFDLALAQYANGLIAVGEATMQRAIELGKPFARLEMARRWLTISSLFNDPARLRQSTASVAEWLKAEPSNPAVLMATGVLHELQNNPGAAEQAYARLIALYPAFSPAVLRLARLQAGRPATLPQAFEAATRLRQALPDDPEVAALLGAIAYKRADYARAAQLLAESARRRTADAEVWYYLGLAQHQLKQPAQARQALEKLLALESTGDRATEARRILAELK